MSVAVAEKPKFPKGISYIVGNEACERFSYYGMRAILVIFMAKYLMMPEADAKSTYHLFISACYLTPLLGGFIADRLLGKYKTIMILSLVYCIGHAVLSIWENKNGLYWGLGLIALGAGGIKPCVSAHVGDQFSDKNKNLLDRIFSIFYFAINFGAFFSSLLIPWVLPTFGPSVAFGIPGVLMGIATLVFWMGRNVFVAIPPTKSEGGFLAVSLYSLKNMGKKKQDQELFDVARERYGAEAVEASKSALSIFKVFATVTVFWALFDQQGSSWVFQAEQMDRNFFGMELQSSQIQALNPIMVMGLIPIFSFVIYPAVEKMGIKLTALRKMSAGMLLAAFSFVLVAIFQAILDGGTKLSVGWQILPYLVITMSEVMVSITGLEFAYTQAPRSMKSTIMSFWFLTVFLGNFVVAIVAKINVFKGASEFYFYAALMAVVSLIFVWTASRYRVRDFVEKSEGGAGLAPAPSAG